MPGRQVDYEAQADRVREDLAPDLADPVVLAHPLAVRRGAPRLVIGRECGNHTFDGRAIQWVARLLLDLITHPHDGRLSAPQVEIGRTAPGCLPDPVIECAGVRAG